MSTRERILDAAAKLVGEGEALTISAAATGAGVSRGTVYRHFASLDALSEALATTGRIDEVQRRAIDPVDRILDAVTELLRQRGLSGWTIEGVARQAHVSPMTIYRHFGDRRGLLQAFMEQRTPRRLAAELPAVQSGDLATDLRHIALVGLRFLDEHRDLFQLAFSAQAEEREMFADIRRSSTSMRSIVARVVASHIPDAGALEARAFLGVVMALGWEDDGVPVATKADRAVSIFLHGVLPAGGTESSESTGPADPVDPRS